MSYLFFPGCSLEGTARDFHESARSVARVFGIELPEVPDWTCCGSTSAHQTDPLLAVALPARSLVLAAGQTVAVCCAACYGRLKTANHEIAKDATMRARVAEVLGTEYDGKTPVLHLLEILGRGVGPKKIAESTKKPLKGLRVATYYGCLLSRPPEVTSFDDVENPTLMDRVLAAAGADIVDWPHKTECCGAGHSITDVSIVQHLGHEILSMAKAAGADCVAAACPLCQANLDLRQSDVERETGERYGLPVFYFTQLLGLALGLSPRALGIGGLIVDPHSVLSAIGASAQ